MSKQEKLLQRFLSKPKDFRYNELRTLLNGFGYEEIKTGRTSGSRVAFFNNETSLSAPFTLTPMMQFFMAKSKE